VKLFNIKNPLPMKVFMISLCLLLSSSIAFGIGDYTKGEELYIWATSGLNLRSAPNSQATKIINIPFGEKVKVVDTQIRTHPFSYAMIKSENAKWVVNGHWVQVAFQQQTGYVFDGYLSQLYPITGTPEEAPYFNLDLIKSYGKDHWGGLQEETKTSTINFDDQQRDPDKGHSSSYKLTFKNGAYYENISESYSGYTNVFIKNISLEEAYLFFNTLTGFEYKQKLNSQNEIPGQKAHLSSAKENELQFNGEGMDTINITKVEGGVIIQYGGGC